MFAYVVKLQYDPEENTYQAQAYDSHCNLVLGDVEETIYVVEEDDEEDETMKASFLTCNWSYTNRLAQTIKKQSEMLFVRGQT